MHVPTLWPTSGLWHGGRLAHLPRCAHDRTEQAGMRRQLWRPQQFSLGTRRMRGKLRRMLRHRYILMRI